MFREWGSVSISVAFFIASSFLLKWFWTIANKNLDYVGLGQSVREKTDGYSLYLFLIFFLIIVIKAIMYGSLSIRPNYIFDVAILTFFLIIGMSIIVLRMNNYL